MRDNDGRTVFKRDGIYYFYDPTAGENGNGVFVQIDKFDEILGNRGVPFMYPSYYGAPGSDGLYRVYTWINKWGYANAAGGVLIRVIYLKTFEFSENTGVAYQNSGWGEENFLQFLFLDSAGNNLMADGRSYYAPEGEITKDHLGFFYFDHGLTRVYESGFNGSGDITPVRDILTDCYGTPFYIPNDYNIKGYSNGMILLEKNGYYGFMNYLGEWVANPIFASAEPFYEGVAVIGLENGKKAIIDTQGNLIVKFKYDIITNCTGGIIALFEENEGWTVLNKVIQN